MLHSYFSTSLCTGEPSYTLEELRRMQILDDEAVKWLLNNPMPDEDPLLVLDFVNVNCLNRKAEINLALVQLGGNQISTNVFQFAEMSVIINARLTMLEQDAFQDFFYHPIARNAQLYGNRQTPTIKTCVITSFSEARGKYGLIENYEFFKDNSIFLYLLCFVLFSKLK